MAEFGKGDVVEVWGIWTYGTQYRETQLLQRADAVNPDPQRLEIAEDVGCVGVDISKHECLRIYPVARAAWVE